MQELLNKMSIIFKNQKELNDHLEALTKINHKLLKYNSQYLFLN
jgi:hypothetical protein